MDLHVGHDSSAVERWRKPERLLPDFAPQRALVSNRLARDGALKKLSGFGITAWIVTFFTRPAHRVWLEL